MGILTRGNRNIKWIESKLRIPEGKDVGKPVRLRPWQKKDIRMIYDNPHGTRQAIISFAKKNAKSTECAFLLLAHLCGPEAKPNSQLVSTAQSREQAAVLYSLAAKMVRLSPQLSKFVITRDTIKELFCPELGTSYKALSAEDSTAHGKSAIFVVHDELGQVRGPIFKLYTAIENAMGAHDAPLSIIISTQAPTDADLLSVRIDDAKDGHDPTVVLSLYTADLEIDPFSKKAIRQANPAFGDFLNAKEVLRQAAEAKRMPSQESLYRNYTLNQRVETNSPYVSPAVWKDNGGDALEDWGDLPVYCGLDLSESRDLTAFEMVTRVDGVLHVRSEFWLPEVELIKRGEDDRVPYDLWRKQGHLMVSPGRTVEYEFVAEYLRGVFDRLNIKKVAFDRWNWKHFKPWLEKAGFSEAEIEDKFDEFGQGYQSMSPALRDLDSALLNGNMRHGMHPVLTMCAANSVVQSDPSGNRKLIKLTRNKRIDGMIALTMAVAVLARDEAEEPVVSIYDRPELWKPEGDAANVRQ